MPYPSRRSRGTSRALRPFAALTLVLLGCAGQEPRDGERAPAPSTPQASPAAPTRTPVRLVRTFGTDRSSARFAWASGELDVPQDATIETRAAAAVRALAGDLGLGSEAIAATRIVDVHAPAGAGGVRVVRVGQTVDGIDLLHARLHMMFDANGRLVATGGRLSPNASFPPAARFDARDAIAIAASDAGVPVLASDVRAKTSRRGLYDDFDAPGLTAPARARAVLVEGEKGLERAFELELFATVGREDRSRRVVVSATSGTVLERASLVFHAPTTYRVWADPTGDHRPADGPTVDFTPHPTGAPGGPLPGFAAPSLVTADGFNVHQDPWLPAGATTTTGNNVDAYTDDDSPDGFSAGDLRPTTTAPGVFDYTYDVALDPQANDTQRAASAVEGFFVANWLHDDWYDAGFDEKAGNAQQDNLGRGGVAGDPLLVQVQDGAPNSVDNANATVPADGMSPRLQFYVWNAPAIASLVYSGQPYDVGVAGFGPNAFNVTGEVVVTNDGSGVPTDGCEAPTIPVAGKILLVDRGQCSFGQKAENAESAGAIGLVLVNNMPGPPPAMPGNAMVSIPVLSLSQTDGGALAQQIASGPTTVTMDRTAGTVRDGALDNLVMAHEWGHYLHQRLARGSFRQFAAESEGWGDFVALHLAVREGDDVSGSYSASVYASAGSSLDASFFGIRRYPYSADFAKNPLTFKHIQANEPLPTGPAINPSGVSFNQEEHAAGEVWASMLFDAYLGLIQRTTGATPAYTFDEARARMAKYVVLGLTLAPEDPTYTEQRDALLAAALASDAADALALAEGFAKRGAGSCAVSPPRSSSDLVGVVESFEVLPSVEITRLELAPKGPGCDADTYVDDGEDGTITIDVHNGGLVALTDATLTLTSPDPNLLFPMGNTIAVAALPPLGSVQIEVPIARPAMPATSAIADLTAKVVSASACATTVERTAVFTMSSDEVPSTKDAVEANTTTWTITGENAELTWSRAFTSANHLWHGADVAGITSRALESAPIEVGAGKFVFTFSHAYAFEADAMTNWDGGVIEVSTDGGNTWKDAAKFTTVDYDGPIGTDADNPLGGSDAFTGKSAGYPALAKVALDFGEQFAGQTIQIRFRIGTDQQVGADGWFIDDLAVDGATNQPFFEIVDDACEPGTSTTSSSSGGMSTSSGTGGEGGAFGGLSLAGGCGCSTVGDADATPSTIFGSIAAAGALAALRRRKRAR